MIHPRNRYTFLVVPDDAPNFHVSVTNHTYEGVTALAGAKVRSDLGYGNFVLRLERVDFDV